MATNSFSYANVLQLSTEQLKYGVWNSQGPRPYERVKFSAKRLGEQFLFDPSKCGLMTARDPEGCLVGHAFYVKYPCLPTTSSKALWITQLVVREDHRNKGVATNMIRECWVNSGVFACGLVSSHPYAVKALEAATSSKCNKLLSAQHAGGLIQQSHLPYVQGSPVLINDTKCAIQTRVFVYHTLVDCIRASLPDWQLGSLDDGEEYFAFVFANFTSGCSAGEA